MAGAIEAFDSESSESIASILIPVGSCTLLVPTVAVAEIVPYHRPLQLEDAPEWLLGEFSWRDQRVPLLSLELLRGEQAPDVAEMRRLVVFNNTGMSADLPFIAVPAVGIPKLIQVGVEDLDTSQTEARPFESLRAILQGEETVIPDISSLEQVWLNWRAQ